MWLWVSLALGAAGLMILVAVLLVVRAMLDSVGHDVSDALDRES
jgi:hypothetical protein